MSRLGQWPWGSRLGRSGGVVNAAGGLTTGRVPYVSDGGTSTLSDSSIRYGSTNAVIAVGAAALDTATAGKLQVVLSGAAEATTESNVIAAFYAAGNGGVVVRDITNDVELAARISSSTGSIGTATNHKFALRSNGTDRVQIRGNGNVIMSGAGNAVTYGSENSAGTWTLFSTEHATKGKILFGTSGYDEANNRLGLGTASPSRVMHVVGGSAEQLLLHNTGGGASISELRFSHSEGGGVAQIYFANTGWTPSRALVLDSGSDAGPIQLMVNGTAIQTISSTTLITLNDAVNLAVGSTTGCKIGTATTQKLSVYNASPTVQGAAVADASGGTVIDIEGRAAINALLARIRAFGIITT